MRADSYLSANRWHHQRVISRALPLRILEQLIRAALIVWAAFGVHPLWRAILAGLAVQLVLALAAAVIGPNHDSPWLLPEALDDPVPAPIDRVDMIAIGYGESGHPET